MRRRRVIGLVTAVTAGLAVIAASAATAPAATAVPRVADTAAQYEVHDVRTLARTLLRQPEILAVVGPESARG